MKILIIKLGYSETLDSEIGRIPSLGDVLRTTPILYALKNKYPDSDISWLVSEEAHPLLEGNKYLNRILIWDNFVPFQLLKEKFDILINLEKIPGVCVPQNYTTAASWFRRGAEHGEVLAMYALGILELHGEGTAKSQTKALHWFRKAASMGSGPATDEMGLCYARGWGVARDLATAVTYWRKAASEGDGSAMLRLGQCYLEAHGVPKCLARGYRWCRRAAATGDVKAMEQLGFLYRKGMGVQRNYGKALKWFRKAAGRGNTAAMIGIGGMYLDGFGVHRSLDGAKRWFERAANAGSRPAKKILAIMGKRTAQRASKQPTVAPPMDRRAEVRRWTVAVVMGLIAVAALIVLIFRIYSPRPEGEKQNESGRSALPGRLQVVFLATVGVAAAAVAAFEIFQPRAAEAILGIAFPGALIFTIFLWLGGRKGHTKG